MRPSRVSVVTTTTPPRCREAGSSTPWKLVWSVIVVLCCVAPVAAQTLAFTVFDAPDAGTKFNQGTIPISINEGRVIAGYYIDSTGHIHGFVRTAAGVITEFDYPGSVFTSSASINGLGQIVGTFDYTTSNEGFLRNADGSFILIQPAGAPYSFATGINDSGQIVGYFEGTSGAQHAFLRDPGGSYTIFDDPKAGNAANQGTVALTINASGEIAGYYADANTVYHGFTRDQSGNFTEFSAPGAGTTSFHGTFAVAINSLGEVTGSLFTSTQSRTLAFVRDVSGTITSFVAPGSAETSCDGVTDSGEVLCEGVVGTNGQGVHGVLRNPAGGFTSFSVPVPNSGTFPSSINNTLSVTGYYIDSNGVAHGFVK